MPGEPIVTVLGRELRALARTRGGRAPIVALPVAAIVCAFLPLADHLGFELAGVLTIVAAMVCPAAGVATIRLQRARAESERSAGLGTLAAALLGGAGVAFAAGIILLNGLRRPTCEPLAGAAWLAVLPLPTCLLATALGAAARAFTKTLKAAVLWIIAAEALSLAWSLSTLYWGPAFFAFDHLFGYLPGPLYDEVVTVSSTVLVFRGMTLLWGVAFVALVSAWGAGHRISRWTRATAGGLLMLALAIVSWSAGTTIGFRSTDRAIASTLGGETTIDDLVIHYPREWSEKAVEQFRRDAAFRADQVIKALGGKPKHHVTVWVYRDADEKRRLVGAAGTSFAKPWRHEVHINASAFPHPVIRHELVHAFGGEIAGGPFRVPGGLFPNTPLVEGFAVALGNESEALTLMQQAKAMRDLHLAPDLTALLSATGFLTAASSRAYSYAGAFIEYLLERFGRDKVLELYRSGDLRKLGEPLQLVSGFEERLNRVELSTADHSTAERWFSRPSIFHRQCAREVSQITDEAGNLLARGQMQEAITAYEHACSLEPDDPGFLRSVLNAQFKAKDDAGAAATAAALLAHPKLDPSLRASVLTDLGDQAWREGRVEDARKRYAEAAALPVEAQAHRNAYARSVALEDPDTAALLKPLFLEGDVDVAELFGMSRFLAAAHNHCPDGVECRDFGNFNLFVAYLLGRQFVQRNAIPQGLPLLTEVAQGGLRDAEMDREVSRLLVRANAEIHDCKAAEDAGAKLTRVADQEYAADWGERCRFALARGWK